MVAPSRHINREDLYALLWQKTMQEVGEDLGVSAAQIGGLCKRLKVPTPPAGYWAKAKHGKPVELAPPLPIIQRGELRSVLIARSDGKGWTDAELEERRAAIQARDHAREEAKRYAHLAEARRAVLSDLSRRSDEAERLRRFLARLDTLLPALGGQPDPEWLTWLRAEVNRIDPFTGGLESIIAALLQPVPPA